MGNNRRADRPRILIKYGGNAMTNASLKQKVISQICHLVDSDYEVILVHGGGPFIQEILTMAGIQSDFIDGHRRTSPEALKYVEMALKGSVNGSLVNLINQRGYKAVGISGKDGQTVTARKRFYRRQSDQGETEEIDLGQVGDVLHVNTDLVETLLKNDYLPVIASLGSGTDGADYNINADMFAGALAGALSVGNFLILTDTDGVLRDPSDPESLIAGIRVREIKNMILEGILTGGMIPKMESGKQALQNGAKQVRIINGKKPEHIKQALKGHNIGTLITQ